MKALFSPAIGFGLLAAFLWGTHSVIARYLTEDLDAMTIAVGRLYIASAMLYAILKLGGYKISFDFGDRTYLLTLFGATTNYTVFHLGLEYTGASNAIMLEETAPFFVVVLFICLGQRRNRMEVLATLLAIAGVYLTVHHDLKAGSDALLGDILELFAGVTWAIFIIASSKALSATRGTFERISFLYRVFVVSAVLLTPFAFAGGAPTSSVTVEDVALLVALGTFPTAIAYYLWYEAAARVSTVTSALLSTLAVVFTMVNAAVFLGEAVTPGMVAGAVLIVGAVLISKLGSTAR